MSEYDNEMHELVGAYMLGAISAEELVQFEEHLMDCAECQEEVEYLSPALEALMDTDPEPLSEDLVQRILAEVPVQETGEVVGAAAAPTDPTDDRTSRARALFALAAGLVLVALAVGAVVLNRTSLADEVAGAADRETFTLENESAPASELVRSGSLDAVAFVGQDFAELGEGERYALWQIQSGGEVQFLGFIRDDDQQAVTQAWAADTSAAEAFALSIEVVDTPPATPSDRITYVGTIQS